MLKHFYLEAVVCGFALAITALLILGIVSLVGADGTSSPWLSSSSPTMQKEFDLAAGEALPTTTGGLGNRDCDDINVVTRPSKLFQSELTQTSCFVTTTFGIAGSDGLLRFNGSRVTGRSVNFGGYAPGLIAIPNSLDFINYTSAGPSGLFLHFTRSSPGPLSVELASTGEVTYRFTQPASASLRDKDGTLLPVQYDSIAFSSNGKWMVTDSPSRAMLRVNIDTLETIPFTIPFNYNLGISPGAQTAVSNDGRFVVVVSKNFSVFRLFDLSTCGPVPNTINGPVSCQSRDLLPYIQSQFGGFIGAFNLRFTSDNVLSLYAAWNNGSGLKRAKYSLLAPGETRTQVTYIGMGDSFASGEGDNKGLFFYEPGTDTPENKCHLSQRSYPYLITHDLGIADFHSVACSGAVRGDLVDHSQKGHSIPNPNPLGAWLPGYKRQFDFLIDSGGSPSFLTISVGGNDVNFAGIIVECAASHLKVPLPNTCSYAANTTNRGNEAKLIADQFTPLKNTYEQLVKTTNGKTKIYVVGYPEFIKGEGGSCGINVHLNDAERLFVANSTHYMNQVIKAAADAAGVYYLDIENALAGRNLCSIVTDPQMTVNGLTEGNDKLAPWWAGYLSGSAAGVLAVENLGIGNESFHPNANGHRLMRDKILSLTGGDPGSFTVCPTQPILVVCKKGDGKVPLPDSSYFGSDAVSYANNKNSASSNPSSPPPLPSSMIIKDLLLIGRQLHLRLDYLLPGSFANIVSQDGSSMGHYTVDARGTLDSVITVPGTVPAGFQSVHVLGTNIGGEQQDYYQSIFVPGPVGDINDNGAPDNTEACGFTAPSGQDIDFDGIDDACDGEIGLPPKSKVTINIRSLSAR